LLQAPLVKSAHPAMPARHPAVPARQVPLGAGLWLATVPARLGSPLPGRRDLRLEEELRGQMFVVAQEIARAKSAQM
jgi:hypothetical protein